MRFASACIIAAVAAGALTGCKEKISPHVFPEADVLPAQAYSVVREPGVPGQPAESGSVVLTLNNAPPPDQPFEQDIVQREIEEFERHNPGIRIEFSTWRFSPQSFFERAQSGSLTDVMQVDLSQMPPIMDVNYAADITDLVAREPRMSEMNPNAMQLCTRNGRVYGVPVEIHTLALFYNRTIFENVMHPREKPEKGETKGKGEKPKGKGADAEPRDYLSEPGTNAPRPEAPLIPTTPPGKAASGLLFPDDLKRDATRESLQLAQYVRRGNYVYQAPAAEEDDTEKNENTYQRATRRGEREVRSYYNLFPGLFRREKRPDSYYDIEEQQQPRQTPARERAPATAVPGQETSDIESARPDVSPRATVDQDIVTTSEEEASKAETENREPVTTCIQTADLPRDWDSLIRTAVKLTDHGAGVYGYAPSLFAQAGGREFAQWCIQSGLQVQIPTRGALGRATLDVNTSAAAEVVQFMKDLHWRYDASPPPAQCYNDNIMRMFATGKLAMATLPATRETILRLTKLGMATEDIGVAPLPLGPANRRHVAFGQCLILNSQIDRARKAAAMKWILFQLDPERIKSREQYFFREKELTGAPRVPLFTKAAQDRLNDMILTYRSVPLFCDYEDAAGSELALEPPYFTDRLYEALALGVRPIVEQKASDPTRSVAALGADFEARYLRGAPSAEGLKHYLKLLTAQ